MKIIINIGIFLLAAIGFVLLISAENEVLNTLGVLVTGWFVSCGVASYFK